MAKANQQKSGSKASETPLEETPKTFTVDISLETYIAAKEQYMSQVPVLARHPVKQYFEFLKKLSPEEVMDWMEGGERLKDLYSKANFGERIALAAARGLIKSVRRVREGAKQAICFEVAAYTLRFENPAAWEVIAAFGDEGIRKLKQGIQDIREILELEEA